MSWEEGQQEAAADLRLEISRCLKEAFKNALVLRGQHVEDAWDEVYEQLDREFTEYHALPLDEGPISQPPRGRLHLCRCSSGPHADTPHVTFLEDDAGSISAIVGVET